MRITDNSTGLIGENFAVKYLKKQKYKIVEQNYHSRMGEIDIVAQKDKYIVFVEVKTRDEKSWYDPIFAVTSSKKQKIIKTTQHFIQFNHKYLTEKYQIRFDVITVVTRDKKPISIEHIENAFY